MIYPKGRDVDADVNVLSDDSDLVISCGIIVKSTEEGLKNYDTARDKLASACYVPSTGPSLPLPLVGTKSPSPSYLQHATGAQTSRIVSN